LRKIKPSQKEFAGRRSAIARRCRRPFDLLVDAADRLFLAAES